jgi:hypothetical protein
MQHLLYVLPALACPVGMGAVMWLMMRPGRKNPVGPGSTAQELELADLRSQIADLRATRRQPDTTSADQVSEYAKSVEANR